MADNDTASTAATNPLDESRRTTDWAFRLLKDVDEFFGNPIGARLDAKALKERLNKELGPWHDFLYDKERDVYYRPVLATTKFNTYMKLRYQAGFQPKGKCTATARWAQLVHALGITPDMNIVDKSALEPGDEQNIRLKVDGQVVCHIVNILQSVDEYPDRPWAETGFDTEVGSFSWDHLTSKYRELQYQPLGEEKMAQMHPYFPRFQQRRSGSTNADELWMRYELALSDVGISDTTFAWPDPKTTITERLEKRTKFINDLKSLEFQQRPMFIAQKWKFDADRILCRAIDAGRVDKLLQDACVPENCHGSDQIRQALLSDLQKPDEDITDRTVRDSYDAVMRLRSWLRKGSTVFEYGSERDRSVPDHIEREAIRLLDATLASYKDRGEGTWQRYLYLSKDDVVAMFTERRVLLSDRPIAMIPCDNKSILWNTGSVFL